MKRKRSILAVVCASLVVIAGVIFFGFAPAYVDSKQNRVVPLAAPGPKDSRHVPLYVADLHNDALLWSRDLASVHSRGHSDLPRLRAGNIALQVFSAVTKSPAGLNNQRNDADARDDVTPLAIAQRWPMASWTSLYERAVFQLEKLQGLAERHPEQITLIRSRDDLLEHRARYQQGTNQIAALYLIEGAHPLEGEIDNLDRLFAGGLRIIGLTHFFDNDVAGSLHGLGKGGLTDFGRTVVERADELGMVIDIAHASPAAVRETLALSGRPMILSHGGMAGHCATPRNLDDELMRAFAEAGGLLGIGFWSSAVCDATPTGIAGAVDYAVKTLGIEHVALGSDFDGAVTTRFDASRFDLITGELYKLGYSEQEVSLVMGENAYRFFLNNLPTR